MPLLTSQARDRLVIIPYIFQVLPQVGRLLAHWQGRASAIPDPELSSQALLSIKQKSFHCQGGSIYALYAPEKSGELLSYIVAVQTISDYLDNLCDRVLGVSETAMGDLHQAMTASVGPGLPCLPWYRYYPYREESYLTELVAAGRRAAAALPGYHDVNDEVVRLALLYGELQVYKHLAPAVREERLKRWFSRHGDLAPGIQWWEFGAACGSTLGIFALAALAAGGPVDTREAESLLDCYFPWICGLHIMLDYFIDLDEDRRHGDLNFVSFYGTTAAMEAGLLHFLEQSLARVQKLRRPRFHQTVVEGLLALYLSDPKASAPERKKTAERLLLRGGAEASLLYRSCLRLRRRGII